jgi:hypothetical protein
MALRSLILCCREKADRPFRCLDCQYRRELVRVYLTNVEQICRRFVEERRSKLGKLIDDNARWSRYFIFTSGFVHKKKSRTLFISLSFFLSLCFFFFNNFIIYFLFLNLEL